MEPSLRARHCACSVWSLSNILRLVALLFPFHKEGNRLVEELNVLPRVAQLVSTGAGMNLGLSNSLALTILYSSC